MSGVSYAGGGGGGVLGGGVMGGSWGVSWATTTTGVGSSGVLEGAAVLPFVPFASTAGVGVVLAGAAVGVEAAAGCFFLDPPLPGDEGFCGSCVRQPCVFWHASAQHKT